MAGATHEPDLLPEAVLERLVPAWLPGRLCVPQPHRMSKRLRLAMGNRLRTVGDGSTGSAAIASISAAAAADDVAGRSLPRLLRLLRRSLAASICAAAHSASLSPPPVPPGVPIRPDSAGLVVATLLQQRLKNLKFRSMWCGARSWPMIR